MGWIKEVLLCCSGTKSAHKALPLELQDISRSLEISDIESTYSHSLNMTLLYILEVEEG